MNETLPPLPNLELLGKLGEGGMSTVWKAWDIPNQRLVAVKILDREFASDGAEVRQFRDYLQAICKQRESLAGTV